MARTQFVGRRSELERLGRVLRGGPDDAATAVVTGDAGIGKTRLLREAVTAAPDVRVLAGSCLPLSQSLPYGAVTAALATLTGPSTRPELDKALARCAPYVIGQVAALIPVLQEPGANPNADLDRTRLFSAVRDLLEALAAERRTAVVVEDLHWADPGTLDLLTFIAAAMPPGVSLVSTSRHDELAADEPVRDWLAGAVRLPEVELLTVAPLTDDEIHTLVADLVEGEPAAELIDDVRRRAEGNPFFTEQLVAAARDAAPPFQVPTGVPAAVEQMLLSRVRSVGVAANQVASALAVAARPLAEAEIAVCVGTGVDVTLALRELADARLVDSVESDKFRLRHALLEDTVRGTLIASQRAVLHAGVARLLAARRDESPFEVASHWALAGDRGQEARWLVQGAQFAERVFAWEEATAAWRRVWELWDSLEPVDRPAIGLSEAAVAAVVDAERWDDDTNVEQLLRDALADDRVTRDPEALGRLLRMQGERLTYTDLAAGLATLERAVDVLDRDGRATAERARALQALAQTRIFYGVRTGREREELDRATAIAEQADAVDVLIEIEGDRSLQRLFAGDVEEGLLGLTSVCARAEQVGASHVASKTAINLSDTLIWLLQLPQARDAALHAVDAALSHGYGNSQEFSLLVANTVEALHLIGDVAAAEELVATYLSAGVTLSSWPLHLARAEIDILAGDLAGALTRVERVQSVDTNDHELQMWIMEVGAQAELWQGEPGAAWAQAERVWTLIRASQFAWRAARVLTISARAAADLRELEPAVDANKLTQELHQRALASDCFAPHPARALGLALGATFEAELARLVRDGEAPAWRRATAVWSEHGVPHHAAYAGWRLTECLLVKGYRKDAERELAVAHAAAHGHGPLRQEIEGLARRSRLTLPTSQPSPVPSAPEPGATGGARYGLTAREVEVLRLLGTGATNAEIGKHLYMSPKTASVHVSAILRKLGVTGRVQAATLAERTGLLSAEGSRPTDL